jgi:hypothetical protein
MRSVFLPKIQISCTSMQRRHVVTVFPAKNYIQLRVCVHAEEARGDRIFPPEVQVSERRMRHVVSVFPPKIQVSP